MEEEKSKYFISNESAMAEKSKKSKKYNTSKSKQKLFYNLAVYKAAIDLVTQLYRSTLKSPNFIRYGMIERMTAQLINIINNIAFAASSKDKLVWLKNAVILSKRILIQIRILLDTLAITVNGFSVLSSKSEDLCRQLYGWYKSENLVR